jgi:hypothetical protein
MNPAKGVPLPPGGQSNPFKAGMRGGNPLAQMASRVATAGDFHRYAAKRWLTLPGIELVPSFHKLCKQIVKHDDAWRAKNWQRVGKITESREVKLFLIKNRALDHWALASYAETEADTTVREAARKALEEWARSKVGVRVSAEEVELLVCLVMDANRAQELYSSLGKQPSMIENHAKLDLLLRWARFGHWKDIDKALDRRLAEIKTWWKKKLGVPGHRPSTVAQRVMRRQAAGLRALGFTWSAIAREVDPQGFQSNKKAAIDRIRKVVTKHAGRKVKTPSPPPRPAE